MKLALTRSDSKLDYYLSWLKKYSYDIDIHVVSWNDENEFNLEAYTGIVFTGGTDINPLYYGGTAPYPEAPSQFDNFRDAFEIKNFLDARRIGMPILAICRGVQLAAVASGGSLIQDLESEGYFNHQKINQQEDREHEVEVKGSRIFSFLNGKTITVNSAHHQAIKAIPKDYYVAGYSIPDGVPEILENEDRNSFFLGIQWHPERMFLKTPSENVPTIPDELLIGKFLSACTEYQLIKNNL